MDLFDHSEQAAPDGPLSDRMRPRTLSEIVGQDHLLGPGRLLGAAIAADELPSMVLWGPPGTGKTTLARVVAVETRARFVTVSAVLSGVAELRKEVATAREQKRVYGRRTVLFIDEIHRFNRAQQDALLPHVEQGTVVLIGATTENPSFSVNAALLSRARVFPLEPLSPDAIHVLLLRALADRERGLGELEVTITEAAAQALSHATAGDARRALDTLEVAAKHAHRSGPGAEITVAALEQTLSATALLYDKSGEEHYNVVSAFIKSMRGNDPDAAIYWMMRMVEAGEDPLFLLRRMIIFASEDIGNADPGALRLAVDADTAFQRLGMPEGLHCLAQCCLYLASAPKSNAAYAAFTAARADVKRRGALPVPLKLRNAATADMKRWGYGEGYRYPHDEGGHAAGETYLPDALVGRRYYHPRAAGLELKIAERLRRLRAPSTIPPTPSDSSSPTVAPDPSTDEVS